MCLKVDLSSSRFVPFFPFDKVLYPSAECWLVDVLPVCHLSSKLDGPLGLDVVLELAPVRSGFRAVKSGVFFLFVPVGWGARRTLPSRSGSPGRPRPRVSTPRGLGRVLGVCLRARHGPPSPAMDRTSRSLRGATGRRGASCSTTSLSTWSQASR